MLLRFGLVPVVALCVSLPAIYSALEGSGSSNTLVGLAGPLIAVVYLLLLQIDSVGGQVDRIVALVQRAIASACDHDYASTHREGGIACRLTPEIFHAPLFRYDAQTKVVADLTQACGELDSCRFWFVEGRGGTGKTRTALRLVQALVRDSRLFEYGSRCYLYDFSRSPSVQTELIKKLRRGRLRRAVVMVDNFHLVSADELQDLTNLLVDRRESRPAQLLVFFTRPGDAWNLGPGADIRLLSEAKAAGAYVELGGPQARVVEDGISRIDEKASELVSGLRKNGTASAAQLHLAQVIARNGSVPPDVLATIHLVLGTGEEPAPTADLVALLAILASLSVHRGSFSRSDLRRAIRLVADEMGAGEQLKARQLRASFRRMRRLGLVTRIEAEMPRYVFHEELAELCIDQLAESATLVPQLRAAFESALKVVGGTRLKELHASTSTVEAWLVATEIGDQQTLADGFEAALAAGAMKRMLPCLRRAEKRYKLSPSQRLQLAILLDRTGEFAESRAVFADDGLREAASSDDLAVLLAASRVEVNHPAGHHADLEVLLNHPDPLVRLIGEYWGLHVDTHRGRFAADALLDVAVKTLPIVETRGRPWQIHSLGRMQFDSLRAYYLSGRTDFLSLESSPRRQVDAYLRKTLPNYEGMHLLYRYAHLIGHILLPRCALLDQSIDAAAATFAGLETGRSATVEDLKKAALRFYQRAQDEFWQVGDREAAYLKADVLNAKMIQTGADLPTLKSALNEYRDFIAHGAFSTLNSYPHFYYFRWHMLCHYTQPVRGGAGGLGEGSLGEAERALDRMITCDRESGNGYGVRRGRLLRALVDGAADALDVSCLEGLRAEMASLGYGFERDLLTRLIGQEGQLSPLEMMDVFRYYPFVHQ